MEIHPYSEEFFDQCIAIFLSNQDRYFADYELDEYTVFLQRVAHTESYFVGIEQQRVIACGGFEEWDDEMVLTWGMVERQHHGHGYGKILTTYRIQAIQSRFPERTIKIETSQFSHGFYEKQGFTIQSIEKDGFEPGLDKYTMTWDSFREPNT